MTNKVCLLWENLESTEHINCVWGKKGLKSDLFSDIGNGWYMVLFMQTEVGGSVGFEVGSVGLKM